VDYDLEIEEHGPKSELGGHDEVELFLALTKWVADDMDHWANMGAEHRSPRRQGGGRRKLTAQSADAFSRPDRPDNRWMT